MGIFVFRVWLPDRPGALGAVASRLGSLRADVIGIDVLERGDGRVIDELTVSLDSENLIPLMVDEVQEVDGVEVEDVRPAPRRLSDPRTDVLETASLLVEASTVAELLSTLVGQLRRDFIADWCSAFDPGAPELLESTGPSPSAAWLEDFVVSAVPGGGNNGAPASGFVRPDSGSTEELAWASLGRAGIAVVLGRRGRPFRSRERRQLATLARIADYRWEELSGSELDRLPSL